MKRVGLFLHAQRAEAVDVARTLAGVLRARGIEVTALPGDAARIDSPDVAALEAFPRGLDLVFVLGGDGTLLRAAQAVSDHSIPLLGVNLGRLGFLSELERGELEGGLARVLEQGFEVEERMVLEGEVLEGGRATPVWALNDVIVAKGVVGRAIRIAVSIGGEPFVSWAADGLIVSTPTGSTAYSFSAGGPVVSPRLDCIILTPVSPHGLFARSVIVPPDEPVTVRVLPDPDQASLSADGGPAVPLAPGAEVQIRAGKNRARLAKVEPAPFWRLVRSKFDLPELGDAR